MRMISKVGFAGALAAGLTANTFAGHVGQRTLHLMDEARQRPIVVEVWYPTLDPPTDDDHRQPSPFIRSATVRNGNAGTAQRSLILLSHGTGGSRFTMEWLAVGLVHQGHVVAAVDHWGNTFDNPIPDLYLRPWERPQDLSFALTELMRHPDFGPVVDPERVGAIGFSLGGYTVLALAGGEMDLDALYDYSRASEAAVPDFPQLLVYMDDSESKERIYAAFQSAPSLRDSRFRAVIALAPAIGHAFTNSGQFERVTAPVLIVGAEADKLAPVKTNSLHYHELVPGSLHVLLRGEVGHFVFLNEAGEELKRVQPELFQDHPTISRKSIHDHVINLADDFLAEHLLFPRPAAATR